MSKTTFVIARIRPYFRMVKCSDGQLLEDKGPQYDRAVFDSVYPALCDEVIKEAREKYPHLVPEGLEFEEGRKNGCEYVRAITPIKDGKGRDCDLYIHEYNGSYIF